MWLVEVVCVDGKWAWRVERGGSRQARPLRGSDGEGEGEEVGDLEVAFGAVDVDGSVGGQVGYPLAAGSAGCALVPGCILGGVDTGNCYVCDRGGILDLAVRDSVGECGTFGTQCQTIARNLDVYACIDVSVGNECSSNVKMRIGTMSV